MESQGKGNGKGAGAMERHEWIMDRQVVRNGERGKVTRASELGYDVTWDNGTVGTYGYDDEMDILEKVGSDAAMIDYPRWSGALQAKLDLTYVDIYVLLDIYADEIATLPQGAQSILDDIKAKAEGARRMDRNPPQILPYK